MTSKIATTKQARKQAKEDVKLLQNRINLLKLEEKKAWKKIEEKKKKAYEVMKVRQRNEAIKKQKDDRRAGKEAEMRMLQEKNMNQR